MVEIFKAGKENLEQLAELFDAYRVFYGQASDRDEAKVFLEERFDNNESILFLAAFNGQMVGFTQLFPSFSSVSMQRSFILNDLYVVASFRQQGIGEALLNKAKDYCIDKKCKGLALETATTNKAQKLYEKLGWVKDVDNYHYFWKAK